MQARFTPDQYLAMPLSVLVGYAINAVESRMQEMTDAGAKALADEIRKELMAWRRHQSILPDKEIHLLCLKMVGVIPAS